MSIFKKKEKIDYKELYFKELIEHRRTLSKSIYMSERLAAALKAMQSLGLLVDQLTYEEIYITYCAERDEARRKMEERNYV